jgi:hypothetical protein
MKRVSVAGRPLAEQWRDLAIVERRPEQPAPIISCDLGRTRCSDRIVVRRERDS